MMCPNRVPSSCARTLPLKILLLRLGLLISLLQMTTGCATSLATVGRATGHVDTLFPATRIDLGVAHASMQSSRGGPSFDFVTGELYWLPLALIDLPISILSDTVFLPVDTYNTYLNPTMRMPVEFRVIDASENPIPHAEIAGYYRKGFAGRTDAEGAYVLRGKLHYEGHYAVRKHSYYATHGRLSLTSMGYSVKRGRWLPNDPVIPVVLRPVTNPIPMYARKARVTLPAEGGLFGYDLAVGDLVAPHGKGLRTDLLIKVDSAPSGESTFDRRRIMGDVSFPDSADGLRAVYVPQQIYPRSEYRMPFQAPEEGYLASLREADSDAREQYQAYDYRQVDASALPEIWHWTDAYRFTGEQRTWDSEVNYFLRVRSHDPEGPLYGLIRGRFSFKYTKDNNPVVSFTYYLNPDHSTNIEYDPKRNLFKNLDTHDKPMSMFQ